MTNDILIVDDERDIRELIADILEDEGYQSSKVGTADEAIARLEEAQPALLILDIWLKESHMDGIDILKRVRADWPEVPVVIISGHGNIEIAVAAIKQGAYDFIEKPFNIDQLLVVVRRAMETSRLRRENLALRRHELTRTDMVGCSAAFKTLMTNLDKVTGSNARVLLKGPAGAGKEIAARYIHAESARANAPFVSVSAASIAPEVMEEVLFGSENGAEGPKPGLFEQANGGVLFFDEIADMPLGTQSKILRVLVEQKFTRVGGTVPVRVDLRVISSTTKDLEAEIAAGHFRRELLDRLSVVPIEVPGLARRAEDIAPLAEHFIAHFNKTQGLPLRELSAEAAATLQTFPWPGNIRQLKNLMERVLILGEGQGPITLEELVDPSDAQAESEGLLNGNWASLPLREARELFERDYLAAQIKRFGGNISRTATFVGMERSALHRKLKSLSLTVDELRQKETG